MIFDGPKAFPNSIVRFTRFKNHETRQMFAYLRELEELKQDELCKLGNEDEIREVFGLISRSDEERKPKIMRKIIELLIIQKNLIWMSHNVTGADDERAERRRGFGSEEHRRMGNSTFHWTKDSWLNLLKKFTGK